MSEFVPIPGYPKYKVNKQGVVLGQNGKPLKGRPTRNSRAGSLPYLMVALYNAEGRKDIAIHRLVLEAFVGPCPDGQEARHLNGQCQDNRLRNLKWGSKLENGNDRRKHRPNCSKCGKKLEGHNLMMVKNGRGETRVRKCRSCHNERCLARYYAKKAAS